MLKFTNRRRRIPCTIYTADLSISYDGIATVTNKQCSLSVINNVDSSIAGSTEWWTEFCFDQIKIYYTDCKYMASDFCNFHIIIYMYIASYVDIKL